MKYDYIEYVPEHMKVQQSEVLHDDNVYGGQKILIYFTNTLNKTTGIAEVPTYKWIDKGNLSSDDIAFCNKVLHWNASGFFKNARDGGMKFA